MNNGIFWHCFWNPANCWGAVATGVKFWTYFLDFYPNIRYDQGEFK